MPLPNSLVPCIGKLECLPFKTTLRCEPLPWENVAPCCSSHFLSCFEFIHFSLTEMLCFKKKYIGGAGRSRTDLHGFANTAQTRSATVLAYYQHILIYGVHNLVDICVAFLTKVCRVCCTELHWKRAFYSGVGALILRKRSASRFLRCLSRSACNCCLAFPQFCRHFS